MEKLKQKIIEANPEKKECEESEWPYPKDTIIRLADVIVALLGIYPRQEIERWEIGKTVEDLIWHPQKQWNLKDNNLDNQSPECIKFLKELLL